MKNARSNKKQQNEGLRLQSAGDDGDDSAIVIHSSVYASIFGVTQQVLCTLRDILFYPRLIFRNWAIAVIMESEQLATEARNALCVC